VRVNLVIVCDPRRLLPEPLKAQRDYLTEKSFTTFETVSETLACQRGTCPFAVLINDTQARPVLHRRYSPYSTKTIK
jgi:hypothetical protein